MVKQFFAYLSGEVIFKLVTLFLFFFFVNNFSKEEYALYGIIIANIAFFSMFVRFGQHAVVSRYYFNKEKNLESVFGVVLLFFIITSTLFVSTTFFLFDFYKSYL